MKLGEFKSRPRDGRECFAKILEVCESPKIAIYNIKENHLECAPDNPGGNPRDVERKYALDSRTVSDIKARVNGAAHVILAYDFCNATVYIIDAVPELQIASAVMTVLFEYVFSNALKGTKKKCECEEDEDPWEDDRDELPDWDDEPEDDIFDVTHANARNDDYISGLKRLKPSFELTF